MHHTEPRAATLAASTLNVSSDPNGAGESGGHARLSTDSVGPVSRVHDMGGQTGFGPVPVEDDGRYFHADWEARVYAIVRVLQRRGVINAAFDDLRDAIERIPPAEYLTMSYYERWLRAAEMLLVERKLLADD
jgi:nitrile hydratase subunit beta